jgi:hypothetical protein
LAKLVTEKQAEAFRSGQLLPHEVTPHVRAAAAMLERNRQKNDTAIQKQETLVTLRLTPAPSEVIN